MTNRPKSSHANRGKGFERYMRDVLALYEKRGAHCQQNHPEATFAGKRIKKHGFDFQVFTKGVFYAFDTKKCEANRWNLSNAKEHQREALKAVWHNDGVAFFLVNFVKRRQIVMFEYPFLIRYAGLKSFGPENGEIVPNGDCLGIPGAERES